MKMTARDNHNRSLDLNFILTLFGGGIRRYQGAAKLDDRFVYPLESELDGSLHEPRRRGLHHPAEQTARKVTVNSRRPEKLGVIEGVERFQAKL
jgi:hypothetical protein